MASASPPGQRRAQQAVSRPGHDAPAGLAGFREAWEIPGRLWASPLKAPAACNLSCCTSAGEWPFIETLRHLVFATGSWIRQVIAGDLSPWDPLHLP